jgi:hypothetical protein
MMRINDKLLSIPPYISTSWENVRSLQIEPAKDDEDFPILIVTLTDGQQIHIPHLNPTLVEAIFAVHAKVVEHRVSNQEFHADKPKLSPPSSSVSNSTRSNNSRQESSDFLIRFGISGVDGSTAIMQHNASQSNAPDLPKDILRKIANLARSLGMEDTSLLPQPEPLCNCYHCQIARSVVYGIDNNEERIDETVNDEDLRFCNWNIKTLGGQLFSVINKLDSNDFYHVCLDPLSCSCKHSNCEHMRAVLESDEGMAPLK